MTRETKGADISEIALAPALTHCQDVVGVPQTFPADRIQAKIIEHNSSITAASTLQPSEGFHCVDMAQ